MDAWQDGFFSGKLRITRQAPRVKPAAGGITIRAMVGARSGQYANMNGVPNRLAGPSSRSAGEQHTPRPLLYLRILQSLTAKGNKLALKESRLASPDLELLLHC
jgi:hypothetical protein